MCNSASKFGLSLLLSNILGFERLNWYFNDDGLKLLLLLFFFLEPVYFKKDE